MLPEVSMLPTVDFFGHKVTRAILGDNPANGHIYIPDIIPPGEADGYYTQGNVVKMLARAEETGYNTALLLSSPKIFAALREYKAGGGGLNVIFQTYPPSVGNFAANIDEMMEFGPIAIYHQGSTGEYLLETGKTDVYLANFETIRRTGLPAGMGFHDPDNVLRAEREGWGADFYILCPYNSRRNRKGSQSGFITGESKAELVFDPGDRHVMYGIIRGIPKPVVVIKALAGGQVLHGKPASEYPAVVEAYLAEAYASIKPSDVVCIGVFQRDTDQLKQNAEIVARILG